MAGAAGGFVTRSFDSMLKECSGKKFNSLHSSIKSYLDSVKEDNQQSRVSVQSDSKSEQNPDSVDESVGHVSKGGEQAGKPQHVNISIATALSTAGYSLEGDQAELVLKPLRLAFETKNMKIVELAMDCLHKLIAYDHLEGDPGLEGGKNASLFADILIMVCSCVDNSSLDSTILQVLKVLLTAVASTKFRVHGESLLGVVRVCYSIALNSKSPINQATSKAMLTQMISIIFRRMEFEPITSHHSKELQDQASIGSGANTKDTSTSISKTEIAEGSFDDQNGKEKMLDGATSQIPVKDPSLASVEELLNLANGADIKGLEALLGKAMHPENGSELKCGMDLKGLSIGHQDALLLFRTLCEMAMKEDNDDNTTKKRILSLEILQGILESVSHAFTKNFYFIDSVKAYLSYTLLRASVSQSSVIFQHAAGIFAVLLLRFRENLKGEIGIFFPLTVVRYLDNAECPSQRQSVLRMLEKVCKDPQMLVDLYVNYDCGLNAPNLFERMVTTLSKLAQLSQASDPSSATASQNASVKGSSLQCLVNVLKSLVDWEKAHKELKNQSKNGNSVDEKLSGKDSVEKEVSKDASSYIEMSKAHRSAVDDAVAQFNMQPSKGIECLISNKMVEKTPASVADFLKNTSNLDKAVIGDFLGQQEDFPRSVMHAYVDSMSFSGMTFDAAMREFLGDFRLPGEAQKIDRIIEKFVERYCADNPGLFNYADTAYALAYAVIVLNTDAHNSTMTSKLSKDDFVRMISMPNAEEVLPLQFLEELYDSITKEEIKIKYDLNTIEKGSQKKWESEERSCLVNILNLALPRRKLSVITKSDIDALVKKTQTVLPNQGAKGGLLYTAQKVELVQPMVEAVGWPLLATFSVVMGEGDNKSRILLCMEGFKAGIHITHALGMDTMRYAFLTSLIRFTFLHSPKEMRSKNVEALRTLLVLCDSDIDSLVDSWNAVLECISRLELITSNPSIAATVMLGSNQISRDALLQSLRELAGEPMEHVFLNSARLPSDAVVEFFTGLCSISGEELKQTPPRVFSLQKLVEISYYNMARIRMVWARIWSVLANHFIHAGSHHDEKVARYAVDSLKQLGMKYLERPELANFTFQNDILNPFVVLMRNCQSESARRLIVDCIVQMIKSNVSSFNSGWRSVFMIFTAAADDDSEPIVEIAFENVEQVILEHFDRVVGDCFMDCVNCLIGFANNKSSFGISLKAIALLRICETRLSKHLVSDGSLMLIDKDPSFDVTEHYWFPMLAGLSDLTSDPRAEVRNCALEVLFDLLNERGSKFSSSFWESIFLRVLFPIFDHVRNVGNDSSRCSDSGETLQETCIHSLQLLCNLFNTFYKEVCFMLPPLLSLLLDCAKKPDQSVVSLALGALVHLIEVGGHQFSDEDWDTLLKSIRDASYTTQPLELLNDMGFQHTNMPNHLEDSKSDDNLVNSTGDDSVAKNQLDANEDVNASHMGRNYSAESFQDSELSEGLSSPSAGSQKQIDIELQRNQSLGQRIMGNMMDNRLLRTFTSKPKNQELDVSLQSQTQAPEDVEHDSKEETESPLLAAIRSKCITQLLLLGAIDCIQKKYWSKLKGPQKLTTMELLLSILDFASSYNSYTNLRLRMQHVPAERSPLNLLRQELAGTSIYMEILLKTTLDTHEENTPKTSEFQDSYLEQKLNKVAEEKLVSFCTHVLKEASEFLSAVVENTNMEIHHVLELRSSVIVKVISGMSSMKSDIFKTHLKQFYPLLTKLISCDQMDVRRALGDLFRKQLKPLLP